MQLTRRAEYAIRAMLDLAAHYDDQPIMSKDISVRQDIPLKFLNQIVAELRGDGLIHTVRGSGGGIYLAKKPSDINIRQIVEAIEGPIALNLCLTGEDGCDRRPDCSVHKVWRLAQDQMLAVLESTNLARLAEPKKVQSKKRREQSGRIANETEIEV